MLASFIEKLKKESVFYPVVAIILIPILIAVIKPMIPGIISILWLFIILMPFGYLVMIVHKWASGEPFREILFKYLVPVPPGYIYGTDIKNKFFPVATALIIFANTFIFFFIPENTQDAGIFLPRGNPSNIHILISFFSSTVLHANFSHLFGNMLILWVVGNAVESRTGTNKFLLIYFICTVASQFIVVLLLSYKGLTTNADTVFSNFHSLGASGAVAGVMGVFVIRCFFAKFKLSLPFFFLPVLSIPIKVQGAVLVGLFFAMDLDGSMKQFDGTAARINYWAHVGGYLGGFLTGYLMSLHQDAAKEAVEVKAERFSTSEFGRENATKLYTDILENEPCNVPALKYFLKLNIYSDEKSEPYFVNLVHALTTTNFEEAINLIEDYKPKFVKSLYGNDLIKIGLYYQKSCDLFTARLCFQSAVEKKGEWQAKALYQLAQVFEELENIKEAICIYDELILRFPETLFSQESLKNLSRLSMKFY